MPIFKIGLAQTILVEIEASNLENAIEAVNFVGNTDESSNEEQAELGFRICEIRLLERDAFDISDK